MAIYRGAGGAGDATADAASEASLIKTLAVEVQADADAAEAARAAAVVAKNAAEIAETNAETAEANAETAETNAETAQAAASGSATSAASSASTATTQAGLATTQATNAATSASAASTSASNAATSATSAANSASAASTSATNASNSASAASTSAANAANSATAADASADAAAISETNAAASAASINLSSIAITGGSINGTTIGASTPSTGAFTTLSASGAFSANGGATLGDASGDALTINSSAVSIPNGLAFSGGNISTANNLNFTSTGNRITGDFSNATIANRVAFQTSTTNGNTSIPFIPNGTSTTSGILLYGGTDTANTNITQVLSTGVIAAAIVGTGTYQPLQFYTGGSERLRIDTSGNVGIGTSSPTLAKTVISGAYNGYQLALTTASNGTLGALMDSNGAFIGTFSGATTDALRLGTTGTERMRIDSSGNLLVGKTAISTATVGAEIRETGSLVLVRDGASAVYVNRLTSDGTLVEFAQATTVEGTISVSGTTVSYNGGHLARWSQLLDGSKDDTLLKGTVLTNLNEMCVWTKDGEQLENEQLNKMKVSDVEGDTNVAGVFVNWTRDEDCNTDDMNIAMTGDMIIRIAEGVTVNRGDLLMSAGDGTAKPQGDDIVRSKTIAKVTSTNVTCTYADGSYCVPCVLMAC